jgi:hypothetical protein
LKETKRSLEEEMKKIGKSSVGFFFFVVVISENLFRTKDKTIPLYVNFFAPRNSILRGPIYASWYEYYKK